MRIMSSWPWSPRSTSCAPRSSWNRDPTPSLRPSPSRRPHAEPRPEIHKHTSEDSTSWRITLPHDEAAMVDAALQSHLDALVAEWKRDHGDNGERVSENGAPFHF